MEIQKAVIGCCVVLCLCCVTTTMKAAEKEKEGVMLKNVKPMVAQRNVADLAKPSRAHAMYAALENAMQILGEPYDYDFLMGISGHAFRLMVRILLLLQLF